MNAFRLAARPGKTETAKENNILQADYITIKFSLLHVFDALVSAYWIILLWGAL